MAMSLFEMTESARYLYNLLENDEIDEQVVLDTLEGIGATEKLEAYVYIQKQFEADLTAYKAEKERMEKKMKTCQNAIDRMKTAVLEFMNVTGVKKAKAGTFDLSIRKTESVTITDEGKIAEEWLKPQPPKIDKAGIKKALKNGEQISGAELTESNSLIVR